MLHNIVIKVSILFFSVTFLASCASLVQQSSSDKDKEREAMVAKVNPESTFDVGQIASELQLAVEVEITAEGVKPISATIIRAPVKSSSALADLLVRPRAGDKVVVEYTIPDPRLVEVDSEGYRTLPKAQTFIYAPLSRSLSAVEIVPVAGREKFVSKGGTIDLRPLIKQACERRTEIKECQEILNTD
jgi:hypothetical protein